MSYKDIFQESKKDLLKFVNELQIKMFRERLEGMSYNNIAKKHNTTAENVRVNIEAIVIVLLKRLQLSNSITNEFNIDKIDPEAEVKKILVKNIFIKAKHNRINTRILNVLKKNKYYTLGQILHKTRSEWLKEEGIGMKAISVMESKLLIYGLVLR